LPAHGPGEDPNCGSIRHWNACRYTIAAVHMLYYTLHGSELDDAEWGQMMARGLLSPVEALKLNNFHGNKLYHTLQWALAEVCAQLEETPLLGSSSNDFAMSMRGVFILERFRDLTLALRSFGSRITNTRNMPVPFPYFHLLNFLMIANLVLIAYAAVGLGSIILSSSCVFFATMVLIGMRAVAIALSDPFGDDFTDLDLEKYMKAMYMEAVHQLQAPTNATLSSRVPPKLDTEEHFNPLNEPASKMKWQYAAAGPNASKAERLETEHLNEEVARMANELLRKAEEQIARGGSQVPGLAELGRAATCSKFAIHGAMDMASRSQKVLMTSVGNGQLGLSPHALESSRGWFNFDVLGRKPEPATPTAKGQAPIYAVTATAASASRSAAAFGDGDVDVEITKTL